jgi:hypothetical protein
LKIGLSYSEEGYSVSFRNVGNDLLD